MSKPQQSNPLSWALVIIVLLLVFVGLPMYATYEIKAKNDAYNEFRNYMKAEHELRKMNEEKEKQVSESHLSGGFFLFAGGIYGNSKSSSVTTVTFSWKDADTNSFLITELPLDRIRIRIDSTHEAPTISFLLKDSRLTDRGSQELSDDHKDFFDEYLAYAVIHCKKEHWPRDIKLPLN